MHPKGNQTADDDDTGTINVAKSRDNKISSRPFSVRFMPRERHLIFERADAEGLAAGAYIRKAALTKCGRPPNIRVERRDALAKLIAEAVGSLGRVASSTNQVARWANSGLLREAEAVVAFSRFERQLAEIRALLLALGGDRA